MHSDDNFNSSDFLDCKQFRQVSRDQLQATESCQSTTNGFVATTKLVDTKARVDASVDAPFAAISTPLYAAPNPIVDMIRRDFCLPSEYDDDLDLATNDFQNGPKFGFKKKALKTYSKERMLSADLNPITDNQDDSHDHLSYSSGLSVEEAGGTDEQKLLTKLDHLNSSSSQKLYENLQNLGEYLSTSYSKTDATINENKKTTDIVDKISEDLVEAPTHFEKSATSGTQSKICDDWSDSDSILVDYTTDPSDDLAEQENKNNSIKTNFSKPSDEIDLLSDIPLSEWQTPMELPASRMNQQFEMAQCSTAAFGFSTASRKLIQISETTKLKGSLLMASVTTVKSDTDEMDNNAVQPIRAQRGLSRIVENRESRKKTKPNHDIFIKSDVLKSNTLNIQNKARTFDIGSECKEATETKLPKPLSTVFEIKKPAIQSKFINSDRKLERLKNIKTISDCDILQTKVVKEVNSTNISSASSKVSNQHTLAGLNNPNSSDICKAFIACQEIINVSADTKEKAIKVLAELQALQLENQNFLNDNNSIGPIQARDEDVAFHTACKKLLGISDQATNNVKEILANLGAITSQRVLLCKPRFDEFNAACKKMINVMEESKNVAIKILCNVKEPHYYNTNGKSVSEEKRKIVTTTKPNTSNDCVIEGNVALAPSASQSVNSFEREYNGLQTETCQQAYEPTNLSTLGTPKLQNQENTDEICLNDFNITLNSQPETKLARTSPCTTDIHPSLSQLVHRSPLDKSTKSAIIGRRNLLTLNRRKLVKRTHYEDNSKTDVPTGFTPMPTHTSTPLVDRNPNVMDNLTVVDLRCNSGIDELTPLNKKRRRCLGLSRMPK